MAQEKQSGNFAGRLLQQCKGPGNFLLHYIYDVVNTCNAVRGLKIKVPFLQADGQNVITKDAEVVMTAGGLVATLPVIAATGGGGSGSVPYSGLGPPTSATLASRVSYVASPIPSLYVDATNYTLYVCADPGSNVTAAWVPLALELAATGGPDIVGAHKLTFPKDSLTDNGDRTATLEFKQSVLGSDSNYHTVQMREMKVSQYIAGVCKQRTVIGMFSEVFQAPDDPA